MTGLNEKTIVQIEVITTKTDAIIAALGSVVDLLTSGNDYSGTISDKLTALTDVAGETRDRIDDMLGVSNDIKALVTTGNEYAATMVGDLAGFRNDYGIIAASSDSYLYQIKQLQSDTVAPLLENIFNATNLTADNVVALGCMCDNTNPALMPKSDGSNEDAENRCKRAQAFLDILITSWRDIKLTLDQTGRVTTAMAGIMLGASVIPGVDLASVPATAVFALLGAFSSGANYKVVQFLEWLEGNRDALMNAIAVHVNAEAAQMEWYAIVDSTLNPITQLDIKMIAKLLVWSGIINVVYQPMTDIGETPYDGTICDAPTETFTIATAQFARYILPDNGLAPTGNWHAGTYQGTVLVHAAGLGTTDIPSAAPYASYALVSTLPADHSPIADFDLSGWWYNKANQRLRFRFDPDDDPSTEIHMVNQSGTEVDSKLFYIGGWVEPVDDYPGDLVSVRLTTAPLGTYVAHVQKYDGGIWQEL